MSSNKVPESAESLRQEFGEPILGLHYVRGRLYLTPTHCDPKVLNVAHLVRQRGVDARRAVSLAKHAATYTGFLVIPCMVVADYFANSDLPHAMSWVGLIGILCFILLYLSNRMEQVAENMRKVAEIFQFVD